MKIGVPCELKEGETRVAVVPEMVNELKKISSDVLVESSSGVKSFFSDKQYADSGARIVEDASKVYGESDIVIRVQPPTMKELDLMKAGSTLVGLFWAVTDRKLVEKFVAKKMTVFSMELIPRITRAQNMDVLSSMSTVSGYKAVLLSTEQLGKFFPLLMTAAGTITPANVLVIGAGVAGLQAIATAKRLGAKVEAFDTRPAVREQVESLGARFVEMELPKDAETAGGYAKEMSPEFIKKEMEAISSRLLKMDVVITTAQVFGKKAPIFITEDMVKMMREGSVIVDIAAEQGGNCALTEAGKTVVKHGVTIMGPVNLPAQLPVHASTMYSRNVANLVKHIYGGKDQQPDFSDEITKSCCVCSKGELVSDIVKTAFGGESK